MLLFLLLFSIVWDVCVSLFSLLLVLRSLFLGLCFVVLVVGYCCCLLFVRCVPFVVILGDVCVVACL